ncbi:MAG: hypothetical protein ABIR17_12940 [Pseudolysinimonas sp.]|uniref:hypothetical protein n=1 Tax=Pseudolysinimonas sp. TaxID=2680009 RepID=UPI00326582FF
MTDATHPLLPEANATRKRRWPAQNAAIAVLLVVGSLLSPLAPVESAAAATHGPGYDIGQGFLGAYSVSGVNVFCLEANKGAPLATSTYTGTAPWHTLDATGNARVNWAITAFGQSSDPNLTAAVNMYVWSIADPVGYNSHGQSGDTWYIFRAPSSQRPAILANLASIRAQSGGMSAATTTGSGSMTFQVDQLNNFDGTLTVSLNPSNASGSVTLVNGVFLTTDSPTIAGVTNGAVLPVRGVPTADGAPYKISAVGDFVAPGGYAGNVSQYSTGSAQVLGGPGQSGSVAIHLTALDPFDRASTFLPVLTSEVASRYIAPGQPFTDTFTFDVTSDPVSGLDNAWLQNEAGEYARITARVTIYQTTSPVVAGDPIPADAVVFETFTVTTTDADGPTVPYTVSTTGIPSTSAYYVAVSEIRAADQSVGVQAFLLDDYFWTDGWGVPAETALVPPSGTSEATALQTTGQPVIDTAFLEGLLFDGAEVRFSAYLRPAAAGFLESIDPNAIDPAAVCTPATLAYQVTQPATSDAVSSGPVTSLPAGLYDWVIEILDDAGDAVFTAPCGVVSERSEIHDVFAPVLTSQVASPYIAGGAPFVDTFTFDVAGAGPWLRYGGGEWAQITAHVTVYETTEPIVAGDPIPADAVVFEEFDITTSTTDGPTVPYTVSTTEIPSTSAYYVAVSQILLEDQAPELAQFLPTDYSWSDGWGVAAETAIVPPVGLSSATTTQAQGLPVVDTAFIDGLLFAGAQVRFSAYLRPADAPVLESEDPLEVDPAAVCTPGNLAYQVTQPAMSEIVVSGEVDTLLPGVYDWVIEIVDAGGTVVFAAECGLVSERSIVRDFLVATLATNGVAAPVHDVATVSGLVEPGDTIRFEAYRPAYDSDGVAVCETANRVWAGEPIDLVPGVADDLEVTGQDAALPADRYWWVESIARVDDTEVHRGVCGLENETSVVKPPLADTGQESDPWSVALWAVRVILLGLATVLVAYGIRRRRMTSR